MQVAKLYRDASLGNAVNIVISHIILLSEDQVSGQANVCIMKRKLVFMMLLIYYSQLAELATGNKPAIVDSNFAPGAATYELNQT